MSLLVVLDVDSTLIQQEVIDLLAEKAGVQQEVSQITELAMNGQLDFEQSLRSRVILLRGLQSMVLKEVIAEITFTPGVLELIEYVHKTDGKVCAVSGGFLEIVEPLATRIGIDSFRANQLEVIDEKLTGNLLGPIIDRSAKAKALVEWSNFFKIDISNTVAVGDGANDIEMLQVSGLAVAFRAKESLKPHADVLIEEDSMMPLIELLKLRSS